MKKKELQVLVEKLFERVHLLECRHVKLLNEISDLKRDLVRGSWSYMGDPISAASAFKLQKTLYDQLIDSPEDLGRLAQEEDNS
jgi:hypothetical protein